MRSLAPSTRTNDDPNCQHEKLPRIKKEDKVNLPLWRIQMVWTPIREWNQKRKLREMLKDPRSARGVRSIGQLERGIGAHRPTTERLLLALGARKFGTTEEWTLNSG